MEMYQKPVMKITELEKVDVLTCSQLHNFDGQKAVCSVHSHHNECEKAFKEQPCAPQQ